MWVCSAQEFRLATPRKWRLRLPTTCSDMHDVSRAGTPGATDRYVSLSRLPPAYGLSPCYLDGRESVRYDRAMVIKRVCVYCASSRQCDAEYHDAAARLGSEL